MALEVDFPISSLSGIASGEHLFVSTNDSYCSGGRKGMGELTAANWSVRSSLATKENRMQRKPGLWSTLAYPCISHRRGGEVLPRSRSPYAVRLRAWSLFPSSHVRKAQARYDPWVFVFRFLLTFGSPSVAKLMLKWTQTPRVKRSLRLPDRLEAERW